MKKKITPLATKKIEYKTPSITVESCIGELQYTNLMVEHLLSVLSEVESMTSDELAKAIIKNGIERHNIDKLVHARMLFE